MMMTAVTMGMISLMVVASMTTTVTVMVVVIVVYIMMTGRGGGGVFGFEGGLEVGQGLGHSAGFDLLHSDQELGPESLELFSHWSEFLLEFGLEEGPLLRHLGDEGGDDVLADVSDLLHDLGDHGLDLGLVFLDEGVDLLLGPFQVLADDGLDTGSDFLETSLDLGSDSGELGVEPFHVGLDGRLEISDSDHQLLVVLLQVGHDVLVAKPEFSLDLLVGGQEFLPGGQENVAGILQVELIPSP